MSSGGGGLERRARRALKRAGELRVPDMPTAAPRLTRREVAERAGYSLDPWQARVVDSEAQKLLMLCSRQSGKSTVSAVAAVHESAICGGFVLLLAPTLVQSAELFRKCREIIGWLGADAPKILEESKLRIEFDNGGRVVSLPGSESSTRGYSAATLIIVDEAARVSDELMASVRPSMATTNGRTIVLSTPHGKRGWFYMAYMTEPDWHKETVRAPDCSRISKKFLEDELRSRGPHIYGQEYLCEFYDPDSSVFASDIVERAMTDEVAPLWSMVA